MKKKQPKGPGNAVDRLRSTYRYLLRQNVEQGFDSTDLSNKVRDSLVSPSLREEMASILEYTDRLGLSVGKLSEASIHIQANQYLVTRRDCSFSNLGKDDFLLVSPGSILNQNLVPSYWEWHHIVYQSKSPPHAILFGQPKEVMALAALGELPADDVLKDASKRVGNIFLCPPDADQIGDKAEEANLIIIPGIGVLSWADSLLEAVENLSIVNHWAGISLLAKS